jgi:hypothetical protein
LSEAIVETLTNDQLHAELADNGVAFARNFGWQRVGAQFEAVVRMAATTGHANRAAHTHPKS